MSIGVNNVFDLCNNIQGSKVNKAGDTMTGDLVATNHLYPSTIAPTAIASTSGAAAAFTFNGKTMYQVITSHAAIVNGAPFVYTITNSAITTSSLVRVSFTLNSAAGTPMVTSVVCTTGQIVITITNTTAVSTIAASSAILIVVSLV
ncbi:MAG: hypothetical protein Faunusvirus9_12 [Faunusvirus sp.]|jgi:hypothetical protein|uniref:Uncharacterized protein n=1 Tax=Faunusvirus sp. TaxID=2487766 RepID=A0A3G4ZYE3_9VIRU|nr:MAG: hypothetical protein Faunusvirus9_12 [Faunusvirus sp.]